MSLAARSLPQNSSTSASACFSPAMKELVFGIQLVLEADAR